MNPYRLALFVTFTIGALYFLVKKRRFDFLTVGYFSAAIYFLPGFFGFAQYPVAFGSLAPSELADPTYLVMIAVLAAILAGAVIYDLFPHRVFYQSTIPGGAWAGAFTLFIALFGLGMTVLTTGRALLDPDKAEVLARLNRWSILWEIGASLAALYLASRRRWILFSIAVALLLFDVYVGIRVSAALVFIAGATMWQESKGRRRLLFASARLFAIVIVAFEFLIMYKSVLFSLKSQNWADVSASLQDSALYVASVTHSEPFITQTILNEVLVNDFRVGPEHLKSVLWQFAFFAPELGAQAVSFNDLFQGKLFPHAIGWGMANNIWAQMWSAGGAPLLAGFILIYVLLLMAGSRAMRLVSRELRATAALLFSYWSFYIHRNDLLVEIGYLKRIVAVAAASLIGAMFMYDIRHRVRRRLARHPSVPTSA